MSETLHWILTGCLIGGLLLVSFILYGALTKPPDHRHDDCPYCRENRRER